MSGSPVLIGEQEPEMIKLLHLGQQLASDPEWALHPVPVEYHGLTFISKEQRRNL